MFSRGNSKRLSNGKRNTTDNRSKGLPLDELRSCISQLEDLVEIARQRLFNDQKRMQNNNSIPSKNYRGKQYPQTPQSQKRNKLRRDKRSRKSSDQETDNPTKHNNSNPSSPINNNNNNQQKSKVPRAQFISLETDHFDHFIFLIRFQ